MAKFKRLDSKKKVLVTGAAGFIGYHLTRRLLELGVQVVGLDNLNAYYDVALKESRLAILREYGKFSFLQADLADAEAIAGLFRREGFALVVNLAAQAGVRYSIINPGAYLHSNLAGFLNILEACRNFGTEHLLYASSSSVYGAKKKIPFSTEDKTDKPVSLYAATKKADELMAYTYSHLFGIPATGLRFFTVYGPYGRPDMAYFSFAEKIERGEPIQVFNHGDMYRDFTYIDDVVQGMENILDNPPSADSDGVRHKVYNIGNNRPEKLMDFIAALEEVLGKTAVKEFLPMQPGDVYQTYADVTELMRDFDFKPETSIQTGLAKFAEWFKTR